MKICSLLLLIVFAVIQGGCGTEQSELSTEQIAPGHEVEPVLLTDENFEREVLNSNQPVLVDMWSRWCPPCMEMKPTIRQLASEFAGRVKIGELDVERNAFVVEKYGIDRYPTIIVFVDGQEIKRLVGTKTQDELSKLLRSITDSSKGAQ